MGYGLAGFVRKCKSCTLGHHLEWFLYHFFGETVKRAKIFNKIFAMNRPSPSSKHDLAEYPCILDHVQHTSWQRARIECEISILSRGILRCFRLAIYTAIHVSMVNKYGLIMLNISTKSDDEQIGK